MFLIQHGFQKGTKVSDCIAAGTAQGVIWSPADEAEANLRAAMNDGSLGASTQAVDPQTYVAALSAPSIKKLGDYPFFEPNLQPRHFTPRRTIDIVEQALSYQAGLPSAVILAPTVPLESSQGRWAQVAASLADTSVSYWSAQQDPRPLLLSVALTQSLLENEIETNAVLNDLTNLDGAGFYLLAEIRPDLDPAVEAEILERALWIIYSLAELNEFRVWVGYSGLSGYAYRAAGAEATAAGWWQKLQYWSPDHWLGGGGGRMPRPRVVLESLMNSLLIEAELEAIRRADSAVFARVLLGSGPLAARYRQTPPMSGPSPTRDEGAAQLFAVCNELDSRMSSAGSIDARIRRVLDDIASAEALYSAIRATGVSLEPQSGPRRLGVWATALQGLARRLGISP